MTSMGIMEFAELRSTMSLSLRALTFPFLYFRLAFGARSENFYDAFLATDMTFVGAKNLLA